jgi:hypothetical protein
VKYWEAKLAEEDGKPPASQPPQKAITTGITGLALAR